MMQQPESRYQSYLLRVWCDSEGGLWRIILEHVDTRARHGFADLESLCVFLREQQKNTSGAHNENLNLDKDEQNEEVRIVALGANLEEERNA